MCRWQILTKLKEYRGIDVFEEARRVEIVKFIEANEHCFERTCVHGHITGSAWLLDRQKQRVLLTYHGKLGKWLQLGGHADGNSDVFGVALQEAREESGIMNIKPLSDEIFDVDVHLIPQHMHEPAHYHYDLRFLLQTEETDSFVISEESKELGWFLVSEVLTLPLEDSLQRMARKTLQRITDRS